MECNLCYSRANQSDSVHVVVWKTTNTVLRTVEITQLTLYVCGECMNRYKAQKYEAANPKKLFLPLGIIGVVIGLILSIMNILRGPGGDGNLIATGISMVIIIPLVFWFLAKRVEKQYGAGSPPISPQNLPLSSPEISAAVYDVAGEVTYSFLEDWEQHKKNQYTDIQKERSYPISFYKFHPFDQISKKQSTYKLVNIDEEAMSFVKLLIECYEKGEEFKARDTFQLISEGYLRWYTKNAQLRNVYLIDSRESATLELLENLNSKEIIGNKRKEVRNEYGDEEWYYRLLKI
jgi:hypothetical protein